MKYYDKLFCTIQIISHKENNNNRIKRIHIYSYSQSFIEKKIDLFNSNLFAINYLQNFLSYNKQSKLIQLWKKTGYIQMIIYIDCIHTKNKYQVINLKINPILHKIVVNKYENLKIPIEVLKIQLCKQIGVPINYFFFNNTIKLIREWYIAQGFCWTQIKWTHTNYNSQNVIKIRINEGEISRILIYCEDIIINKNLEKQIKKINKTIVQSLNLYKNNILNKNDLESRIYYLQKKYTIKNFTYNIQYDSLNNKLIIIIKYHLLDIQYFSSYKLLLNYFTVGNIDNKIHFLDKADFFYNKLIIYISKLYILSNQTNINLILYKALNATQYKINLIYPTLYLYTKLIFKSTNSINFQQRFSFLAYNLFNNSIYYFNDKKYKLNLLFTHNTDIQYVNFNSITYKYKILFNPLYIIKRYLQIYQLSSYHKHIFYKCQMELSNNILNISNYTYKYIIFINNRIYLNICYIIIQNFIRLQYLQKYHLFYLSNIIYLKYNQLIPIKSLRHDIHLILKFCINLHNELTIPEYLLTRFYYDIENSSRRYPINIISIIYSQQIHQYYSLYYFLRYIPNNLYYRNVFFLHNYSLIGMGIKFNLSNILKQIPLINLEYSINSNKNMYFHIYGS